MDRAYKYDPEDFRDILGMTDELSLFYKLHETYSREKTQDSRFALEKHWEDLFFTIKHREVEGFLKPVAAEEIRAYLEELASD